jgi:hypothetical protein
VAADGIKTGSGNKIPLWLFGFLYWNKHQKTAKEILGLG